MYSFLRGYRLGLGLPNLSNAQAIAGQANNELTVQQRMGTAVTQFLTNNPDYELAYTVDAWPEDAPRALLAPWEERVARAGHFDQLDYLFADGTVFDNDDFRRLQPNPKFKKEWKMVHMLYREANRARVNPRARRAEVIPEDDSGEEERATSSRRKTKGALKEDSGEMNQENASKRVKGGQTSKPKDETASNGSSTSVEGDGSTEGGRGRSRLIVYDTDDENDMLSQFPVQEATTENTQPSENEEDSPGPRRGSARNRQVVQDSEDSNDESEKSTSTESSAEDIIENENEAILQVEDSVDNVDSSDFVRRSGCSRAHPNYFQSSPEL